MMMVESRKSLSKLTIPNPKKVGNEIYNPAQPLDIYVSYVLCIE